MGHSFTLSASLIVADIVHVIVPIEMEYEYAGSRSSRRDDSSVANPDPKMRVP